MAVDAAFGPPRAADIGVAAVSIRLLDVPAVLIGVPVLESWPSIESGRAIGWLLGSFCCWDLGGPVRAF